MTTQEIYHYTPHSWTKGRLDDLSEPPLKTADQHSSGNAAERFNAWLAVKVTTGVGTMWCAYAFVLVACVSLPAAIESSSAVTMVSWISQTFLQLVLLSVVIVGQNILAASADKRAEATYNDANAVLPEAVMLQEHLQAQDHVLNNMVTRLERIEAGSTS